MFGIMVIDYVFVSRNNQSRCDTTIIIIIIYHQHPCIREIFTRQHLFQFSFLLRQQKAEKIL